MRKLALLLTVALAVPAAAVAAHKPSHPKPTPVPKVQFVVKGTVSAYTSTSITITVTGGNKAAKTLFAAAIAAGSASPQTFTLSATTTKVVTANTVAAGDKVLVKVKAAKTASADAVRGTAARQVVETS